MEEYLFLFFVATAVIHNLVARIVIKEWAFVRVIRTRPSFMSVRQAVTIQVVAMMGSLVGSVLIWSWLLQFVPIWALFALVVVSEVVILACLAKKKV